MWKYKYNSPIEAIVSLEIAYTNNDLDAVLDSKDFKTEAILVLKEAAFNYDINDKDIVSETAKLLELSLIQSLKENGYPSFKNVEREFSELKMISGNVYFIEEKLFFPNKVNYANKIFLSFNYPFWKVAMIEE